MMQVFDPRLHKSQWGEATPVVCPDLHHVAILLAVKNGARWLPEQLESLERQEHRDWSLFVGDDRSTDASAEVLHQYATRYPGRSVRVFPGPNKGFQANFLSLLAKVPDTARYVAFCDQDDVWKPEKLVEAVAVLGRAPNDLPALYCGRTIIADAMLCKTGSSPHFVKPPGFGNALVQSLAGGNTMVFNRAALRMLRQAVPRSGYPVSHDWWAYQVVTGVGGQVFFDQSPQVIYRQHGSNLVGSNAGFNARFGRLVRLLKGDFAAYSEANLHALEAARPLLTRENKDRLDTFAEGRKGNLLQRLSSARRAGLRRQSGIGTLALWLAIVLKKV